MVQGGRQTSLSWAARDIRFTSNFGSTAAAGSHTKHCCSRAADQTSLQNEGERNVIRASKAELQLKMIVRITCENF